jgi:hypothetical protein
MALIKTLQNESSPTSPRVEIHKNLMGDLQLHKYTLGTAATPIIETLRTSSEASAELNAEKWLLDIEMLNG